VGCCIRGMEQVLEHGGHHSLGTGSTSSWYYLSFLQLAARCTRRSGDRSHLERLVRSRDSRGAAARHICSSAPRFSHEEPETS